MTLSLLKSIGDFCKNELEKNLFKHTSFESRLNEIVMTSLLVGFNLFTEFIENTKKRN